MLLIFGIARTPLFNYRDADARRQLAHGGRKINVLIIHHKAENASAYSASKAVESLSLRADMERRRLLLMKWAKRLEICPAAFEGKIQTNHFDNIIPGGDLSEGW